MYLGDTTTDASDGSTPAAAPSILTDLTQLVQGFTQLKLGQQQMQTTAQINQINIQRAQQGLPLLDPSQFAAGGPTVSVGLAPGVQQLLTYGLLGLGALWLGSMVLKKL